MSSTPETKNNARSAGQAENNEEVGGGATPPAKPVSGNSAYPPVSPQGQALLEEIEWAFAMQRVDLGDDYVRQALDAGRLDPARIRAAVLRGLAWAEQQTEET